MKQNIFLFALIGLLALASADYTCTTQSYTQYRSDFNKTDSLSQDSFQQHFTKFCWSLQNIIELNANSHSATYAINQFSDFLDEENQSLLGAKKPEGKGTPSSEIPSVQLSLKVGAPPNWKSKSSSIKNQGSCGACWAFTTVGLYQTFMMVKGKPEEDLSEQFILECTNSLAPSQYSSDCTGGYADYSLQVVKNFGVPKQTQWPYRASNYGSVAGFPSSSVGICDPNQTLIHYNKTTGAKDAMNVTRYDNITVAKMETLLADGPLGALMYVDTSFQAYKSGVYTNCPSFQNAYAGINHAVVIVGMDADKNYIIKNSWGTTWGDSGFATVSSVNDCALTAYVFSISWGYQLIGSSFIFFLALLAFVF